MSGADELLVFSASSTCPRFQHRPSLDVLLFMARWFVVRFWHKIATDHPRRQVLTYEVPPTHVCLQMLHLIKITFVVPIIRQWWTLHCCLREERETGGVGWLWASPCRNVLLWSEILQTLRWKITHHTGTGTWFQRVQQKSGFAGCYFTVYLE